MSIALAYQRNLHQAGLLEELIEGCAQNQRGAQSKLFHLFYPRMIAMVRRYFSDEAAIDEIMSNGFIRVFKKIHKYSYKGSFEGWMRTIFRHAVTDYAVKNSRYKENVLLIETDAIVHRSSVDSLYYKDLLELIKSLPQNLRVVFNMYAIDGMKHKEIAVILNIKEGTSKWYVSEARKILKEKIEALNLHLNK